MTYLSKIEHEKLPPPSWPVILGGCVISIGDLGRFWTGHADRRPKRLAERPSDDEPETQLKDEDVEAVQKVFKVLARAVGGSAAALRIIVLDHASANVWGGIENVHLVEDWRDGRKLVPLDWLVETGS